MTARSSDLPDYTSPPVTEVVLGVQFNSIQGLLAPHLGLIWNEFKADFPIVDQQPPLEPVFETFGNNPAAMVPMPRFIFGVPTPRAYLINKDRTQLLQVQNDRFLHNWRKMGEADQYPRFERMLDKFNDGLARLNALIGAEGMGMIVPNQCEVSYINQVPVSSGDTEKTFTDLLAPWVRPPSLEDLGPPEDSRILMRYVIRDEAAVPVGRLIVTAEPGWKPDGSPVVQLTLVARGKPLESEGLAGVAKFLSVGRRHIVMGFDQITSESMHTEWGKK